MSTGLPRPGLARSAHRGRIKFLRTQLACERYVARTSMRSALRGPAHQLAVRMRFNNFTHGHNKLFPNCQSTSHAPCARNCACAEGLHFNYTGCALIRGRQSTAWDGFARPAETETTCIWKVSPQIVVGRFLKVCIMSVE